MTGRAENPKDHLNTINVNISVLYRGQKPQNRGKRVSESKNPIFPLIPEKGVSSPKIPIFHVVPCRAMGIFWLETPFSGVTGNGVFFLTLKPSFPDFGVFDPCTGRTDSQTINVNMSQVKQFFIQIGALRSNSSPGSQGQGHYPRKIPQSPAEPRGDPAEPSERPPQRRLRAL